MRRKRTEALKKQEEKKAEWRANGHGSYEEIPEEKEFFNVTRKSDNCVIQVSYRNERIRMTILIFNDNFGVIDVIDLFLVLSSRNRKM